MASCTAPPAAACGSGAAADCRYRPAPRAQTCTLLSHVCPGSSYHVVDVVLTVVPVGEAIGVGVTPTGGGYATFDGVPHPGAVPTPHGTITASWRVGEAVSA